MNTQKIRKFERASYPLAMADDATPRNIPWDSIGTISIALTEPPFYTIQGEGPFVGSPAIFIRLAGCNLQCPYCDTDYTTISEKDGKNYNPTIQEVVESCAKIIGNLIDQKGYIPDGYRQLVVITGGEPFRQEATLALIQILLAARMEVRNLGFKVQVETNGTLSPGGLNSINDKIRFGQETGSGDLATLLRNPRLTIVISPKTPVIHSVYKELILTGGTGHQVYIKYLVGDTGQILGKEIKAWDPGSPDCTPDETTRVNLCMNLHERIFFQPEMSDNPEYYQQNIVKAIQMTSLYGGARLSLQLHKYIGVK